MLICDEFIMLNMPKTGSSFVRAVIKEIYTQRHGHSFWQTIKHKIGLEESPLKELLLPNIKVANRGKDQHGAYSQIPDQFKNREVVSVVRSPYSKFISGYEFKFYAKHPPLPKAVIKTEFPTFPNMTMDTFIDFTIRASQERIGDNNDLGIGNQTLQFIQMFFKQPKETLSKLSSDYLVNDQFKSDIGQIKFLRQEHLKDDLCAFLKTKGFTQSELDIVQNNKRVNQTKEIDETVDRVWSQKALDYIANNEAFLVRMLGDAGLSYAVPEVGSSTR